MAHSFGPCFDRRDVHYSINVESTGFRPPYTPVTDGEITLDFHRTDLVRAAVTLGRTKRHLRRLGHYARTDMRWRVAALRMGLNLAPTQPNFVALPIKRTPLWKGLDPSECSALNYSLGGVVAKLIAEALLDAPLMLHLDLYRDRLRIPQSRGKRPDFVARTRSGQWLSIEAKGRQHRPALAARSKALGQADALTHVRNTAVTGHVVSWVYGTETVKVLLEDPEPDRDEKGVLNVTDSDFILDYYAPIRALLSASTTPRSVYEPHIVVLADLDCRVGLHPSIERALKTENAEIISSVLKREGRDFGAAEGEPYGRDGILVVPGET